VEIGEAEDSFSGFEYSCVCGVARGYDRKKKLNVRTAKGNLLPRKRAAYAREPFEAAVDFAGKKVVRKVGCGVYKSPDVA
jgi:hypothetical protein